jgi:DNA polymerase I
VPESLTRQPAVRCDAGELVDRLRAAGVSGGAPLALVLASTGGLGVATSDQVWTCTTGAAAAAAAVAAVEAALAPRWVWWSSAGTATDLVARGVRVAGCWDLGAVHRLLHGGTRDEPASVWAGALGLALADVPDRPTGAGRPGQHDQLDLLSGDGDEDDGTAQPPWPLRRDGHLQPDCLAHLDSADRAGALAELAARVQTAQLGQLVERSERLLADPDRQISHGDLRTTARSESAAALLCVELGHDGLPVDRAEAERLIGDIIGPRPLDDAGRLDERRRRDSIVLQHVPGVRADLRNPAQVRDLLRQVGIDVSDTRSWRLEPFRGVHPVVEPLLAWRKAERIETTYGYTWLDRDVGPDGRLRGSWQASDGAAGRMTAQSGLHNLPVELRSAVAAEPGMAFVRADLGQIEPRVLAAVSGDPGLVAATLEDDLYLPVAAQLQVDRPVAKIAVLAAMYGQTSGAAGQALRRMEVTYPRALAALHAAEAAGRSGRPIATYGGRHVPVWRIGAEVGDTRAAEGGRGRFTRNALIQGAAAELFKAWAAATRLALRETGAQIVLCLHDELLVHSPAGTARRSAEIVATTLESTARHWFPGSRARFVVDIKIIERWSEAKD